MFDAEPCSAACSKRALTPQADDIDFRCTSFVLTHRTGGPARLPLVRHSRVGLERKVMLPFHLSLHMDIDRKTRRRVTEILVAAIATKPELPASPYINIDRKSTRLNSSHLGISYAV